MRKHFVRGASFFADCSGKALEFPSLQQDLSTDVVIVGGGISGALCAYYFAKQNLRPVLVDKGKIAACSTSVSTSLLQYELDQLLQDLEQNYAKDKIIRGYQFAYKGLQELRSLIQELQLDCDYHVRSCLTYTTDQSKIEKIRYEVEQRQSSGFDALFIDKDSAGYDFSFALEAGVYAKNGGAELNPVKFTKELIRIVAELGCSVYENTEVKDYKHLDEHVELYLSNGNTISCKKVIVATGYDISTFTDKKYCTLYTSYNIVTSPLPNISGWQERCLIKTAEDTYIYLRTTSDDRIIIGGEDTRFIPEFLEGSVAEQRYAKLQKRLGEMFPQLNYSIDYRYNGAFGATDDNLPYIGPDPENKNIWYCLGYGANGILFSTNGARMLSDLYNGHMDADSDLVALDRA